MSLVTHPVALAARHALRLLGLTRPLRLLFAGKAYEAGVDRALSAAIQRNDIVWDVGANIGHYTQKAAEIVGPDGHVYAFEPSPQNFVSLSSACSGLTNVTCLKVGLSAKSGSASFHQGPDAIGATSRIVQSDLGQADTLIEVARGDDLIEAGRVRPPSVLKIDVEGHELEVLLGLRDTLSSATLHDCVIEVHFGLLSTSKQTDAPHRIEKLLRSNGFSTSWIDLSHIRASR